MSTLRVAQTEITSLGWNKLLILKSDLASDDSGLPIPSTLQISKVSLRAVAAPVINAGPDISVRAFDQVDLVGTYVGTTANLSWTQISGPTVLTAGSGALLSFVAPASPDAQTLVFRLNATSADGDAAPDTVTVTIVPHIDWYLNGSVWTPTQLTVL